MVGEAAQDPEPRVRAAAAAGFANAVDEEARSLGRVHLDGMASLEQREFRAAAAEALENLEDVGARDHEFRARLLERLLQDRDVSVILAALETIRSRKDSALVLPVLALLAKPVVAGAALDALADMGQP